MKSTLPREAAGCQTNKWFPREDVSLCSCEKPALLTPQVGWCGGRQGVHRTSRNAGTRRRLRARAGDTPAPSPLPRPPRPRAQAHVPAGVGRSQCRKNRLLTDVDGRARPKAEPGIWDPNLLCFPPAPSSPTPPSGGTPPQISGRGDSGPQVPERAGEGSASRRRIPGASDGTHPIEEGLPPPGAPVGAAPFLSPEGPETDGCPGSVPGTRFRRTPPRGGLPGAGRAGATRGHTFPGAQRLELPRDFAKEREAASTRGRICGSRRPSRRRARPTPPRVLPQGHSPKEIGLRRQSTTGEILSAGFPAPVDHRGHHRAGKLFRPKRRRARVSQKSRGRGGLMRRSGRTLATMTVETSAPSLTRPRRQGRPPRFSFWALGNPPRRLIFL
ncbi:collagen alpha-1(I) chain-like [Penaeus monodon]|uniref:collagen alpha-1(I) chain-like n=1 Tax=Penaeus monodon TaxID=6687 RepID=UPI0018A7CB3B|nr:collagen alpha-1(I) chain-like [Penaeus monodon]